MLIGGIQGNEPGGFLSADLYADMRLGKRKPHRRAARELLFHHHQPERPQWGLEPQIQRCRQLFHAWKTRCVSILKKLISESDYLLNLHDGLGYYHPTYMTNGAIPCSLASPSSETVKNTASPTPISPSKLGEMARKILKEVNPRINGELYKFHFMDTRTDAEDSPHGEQRGSATYYALTKHHIPSFGVETRSSSLPLT